MVIALLHFEVFRERAVVDFIALRKCLVHNICVLIQEMFELWIKIDFKNTKPFDFMYRNKFCKVYDQSRGTVKIYKVSALPEISDVLYRRG
jgi:hypothetical protein